MEHGPHAILPAGTWPATAECDQILLDPGGHHSGRAMIQTIGGRALLIDLEHIDQLRPGDGLALPDGQVVRIHLAPEALLEIHAASPGMLARLAWRLGNAHLPIESGPDWLRLRPTARARAILADFQAQPDAPDALRIHDMRASFTPDRAAAAPDHAHPHHHA